MSPRRRGPNLFAWVLFADLLLALVLVFLAASSPPIAERKSVGPVTTGPTDTEPVVTGDSAAEGGGETEGEGGETTETVPCRPGLSQEAAILTIAVRPGLSSATMTPEDRASIEQQVARQLEAENLSGRPAGFVLAFGLAGSPGPGVEASRAVNDVVFAVRAEVAGLESNKRRDYFSGGTEGEVQIEWYTKLSC